MLLLSSLQVIEIKTTRVHVMQVLCSLQFQILRECVRCCFKKLKKIIKIEISVV